MKNDKGFIMIAGPLCVAFLVGVFLMCLAGAFITQRMQASRKVCLEEAFKGQRKAAKWIRKIQALNPRAKALRLKLKAARLRLLQASSTGQPSLVASALANVKRVKSEQKIFRSQQKGLIRLARADLGITSHKLISLIQSQAKNPRFKAQLLKPFSLSLKAEPKNSRSPDMVLAGHFNEDQEVKAQWNIHLPRIPLLQKRSGTLTGACAVSLDTRLNPKLVRW